MIPNTNRIAGVDYKEIPSGIDENRLEKIYQGLVKRGLPEDDIIVAMSYIVNESGGDPSRNDEYGKGLMDGIVYRDNMFMEDDDVTMLDRQLDSVAYEIESGNVDTLKDIRKTDYGEAIRDRIYGRVNLSDSNSILRGDIGWKYSDGGELDMRNSYYMWKGNDSEPESKRYFKGSPYALPAVEKGSDGKERIVGMSDITSSVIDGTDALLYDDEFMKNHTVYQDTDGRYTLVDNRVLPVLDDGVIGMRVSPEELKKTMPSMDYIGGRDYRLRVAELIPGLMETVKDKAASYGINPNLVLHRLLKEGFIDNITREYNSLPADKKRTYFTDDHLWDESYNGFGELGLDDAGQNIMDGRYELKDKNARWSSTEAENEKGRQLHNVPIAEDLNSALEMVTAEMAYRQSVLQGRGVPSDILDAYTNAAYTGGLNSSIMRDADATVRKYSVPDYYGRGRTYAGGGKIPENKDRLKAEMMARYSGGVGKLSDALFLKTSPVKLLNTWITGHIPEKVKNGKMTPKEYSDRRYVPANYAGTLMYDINSDSMQNKRDALNSNEFTQVNNNDFVSAFFNGEIPMKESGVTISPESQYALYKDVFGANYPHVVGGEKIRAYMVHPEEFPFYEDLDRLAGAGKYKYEPVQNNDRSFQIGDLDIGYDAHNHTLVSVEYNGNVYEKHLDVFDVDGLGKEGSLTRKMTDYITANGSPYIVVSPWRLREK